MTPSEKRNATLLKNLGSPEAVKQYYRDLQEKSRTTYRENGSKGGFRGMDKEKRTQIARLGGEARHKNEKTN